MKIKNSYFLSAFFSAILCAPVLGEVSLLRSGEREYHERPYGVLTGIDTIDSIEMTVLCPDPNKDAKFWKDLHSKVITKFPARIRMQPSLRSLRDSVYRIRIEILALEGSSNYVARVQSSLTRSVYLDRSLERQASVDVWATATEMQVMSMVNMPDAVSQWVIDQVEEFIGDFQKASPRVRLTDANDTTNVSAGAMKESPLQPIKKTLAEYKYVASKNGEVFHRPSCRSVKRISPANLVGYASRQAAIAAGKQPCKVCKP